MDVLLSAVASDLIGRLVSFLIGKYQESGSTDDVVRLQRALVRARVVVEEAEGRQITNRAMLEQLDQLRRELCRAAYALDTRVFRWPDTDLTRSRRWHTTATRSRSPPSSGYLDFLPVMVESLESALSDMREFVVLLGSCPRITRQPYSTDLFMESCMFGRQMEKEEIIGFLLKPSQDLDVLPIIGPPDVGKRTLVENVTQNERVRECFTKIHRLHSDELDLQIYESLFDFRARSLMVVEIISDDTDFDESWRKFHSAVRRRAHRGSKIIVISGTEAHSSLGTVPALRLRKPHREELWYFFKALAFGSADPNERPDLARLAMAICAGIRRDFAIYTAANIVTAMLRTDLSTRSWRRVLKVFSEATMLQLDAASDGLDEDKARHCNLFRTVKDTPAAPCSCLLYIRHQQDAPGAPCLFYNRRKLIGVARSDLPKVTMLGLLTEGQALSSAGETKTRFDVLAWQSRIPPYASYVVTCDPNISYEQVVALKTPVLNKRRRDHEDHVRMFLDFKKRELGWTNS